MNRFHREASKVILAGAACIFADHAIAQTTTISPVRHVGFDTPDGWALKYFTAATMLGGLQPPEPLGEHARVGGVTVGLETGWIPTLRPGQTARVLFRGPDADDLNRSPIMIRPIVRIGLPWRFTAVAAIPPPIEMFDVRPRLFAFALERPIIERTQWTLGWRASGQVGSVRGDFTCPQKSVDLPAGSPENPSGCQAASEDTASLRYAGTEVQFAYRNPHFKRISPHVGAGINYIDSNFQVDAQLQNRRDRTQLWTRGMAFDGIAGVSYLLTDRMSFTVDAFYSPLGVQRDATRPRTIDGLFNVRALVSYTLRDRGGFIVPNDFSVDAVREHYDQLSSFYRALWGPHIHHGYWDDCESSERAQVNLIERLASRAGIAPGSRVLDVGCGIGGSALWLAKHLQCSVTGLTISPVQAQMATQNALALGLESCAHFEVVDARELPFAKESFDAVWVIECSEHLPDKAGFIESCARVLKPRGVLALCAWLQAERHTHPEHGRLVAQVCRGMLCPQLASMQQYTAWIEDSGLSEIKTEDVTSQVQRTWVRCSALVDRPAIQAILQVSSNRIRRFVKAFPAIQKAYAEGAMSYGMFTARKAS